MIGQWRALWPRCRHCEYLLPFVRIGGKALAQKGEDAPAEVALGEAALVHLGGRLNRLIPVELTGIAETRYLVLMDKTAATPDQYPAGPGCRPSTLSRLDQDHPHTHPRQRILGIVRHDGILVVECMDQGRDCVM